MGFAWLGFNLERWFRAERIRKERPLGIGQSTEVSELQMRDSAGAWILGVVALVVAMLIRYW
jgi:hypothetical protein